MRRNCKLGLMSVGLFILVFVPSLLIQLGRVAAPPSQTVAKLGENRISTQARPLISDDFESYTSTAQLAASWNITADSRCSVELATEVSYSPTQSMRLQDWNTTEALSCKRSVGDKREYLYVSVYMRAEQTNANLGCYIYNQF